MRGPRKESTGASELEIQRALYEEKLAAIKAEADSILVSHGESQDLDQGSISHGDKARNKFGSGTRKKKKEKVKGKEKRKRKQKQKKKKPLGKRNPRSRRQ